MQRRLTYAEDGSGFFLRALNMGELLELPEVYVWELLADGRTALFVRFSTGNDTPLRQLPFGERPGDGHT